MIKNNFFKAIIASAVFAAGNNANAQCTPVSEFSENFDALSCCAMGVVPPCWNSLLTQGGNQIISSTSPASSPSNVYQNGYNKISIVVMPELTNINAGTHHFKFKARINAGSGNGLLEFGYVTDASDLDSFVMLQSITIANGTYDATSERVFDVPTSVPSTARLAIRNPGTTWVGHYWDDAVWEPKSNLATNDLTKIEEISISPNPVKDFISLSNIKNIASLQISDASGRLIKTIEKPALIIHVKDLEKGIYFVSVQFKNGKTQTSKLIKQ